MGDGWVIGSGRCSQGSSLVVESHITQTGPKGQRNSNNNNKKNPKKTENAEKGSTTVMGLQLFNTIPPTTVRKGVQDVWRTVVASSVIEEAEPRG